MLALNTIAGALWRFVEELGRKGISVVITLLLALFVTPEDFGLVSMMAIFIAVANSLMESGFKQALIRKQNPTAVDFDTVFYTNVFLGCLVYAALYAFAPFVAEFYGESRLSELLRVVGLAIPSNAFQVVPQAILNRQLKFKTQLKASIPAAVISGVIAVVMAYLGYGVWALIAQVIVFSIVLTSVLWSMRLCRPRLRFSCRSFAEMLGFGVNLMLSELVAAVFKNIYFVTIAKLFSTSIAGYYFFADKIRDAVISQLVSSMQTAMYPALSTIRDDDARLKNACRNIVSITSFVVFPVIALLAALVEPLFRTLLPESWYPAIPYLQIMCVAILLHPIHAINLNILKVKGRSDWVLYLEIYKKTVVTLILLITVQFGIEAILIGQIVSSIFAHLPNSYFAYRVTGYSLREQFCDYGPALFLSAAIALIIYALLGVTELLPVTELLLFGAVGIVTYVAVSYSTQMKGYLLTRRMGQSYLRSALKSATPPNAII
jgi:O-antigen/teichoic acid export membrane protein